MLQLPYWMRRAVERTRKTYKKVYSKQKHYRWWEGDQRNVTPVGVITEADQNKKVRRMSNASIVARKSMSRKSVETTRWAEKVKILSYQMFRGLQQVSRMMTKFSTARRNKTKKKKIKPLHGLKGLTSSSWTNVPMTPLYGLRGMIPWHASGSVLFTWSRIGEDCTTRSWRREKDSKLAATSST